MTKESEFEYDDFGERYFNTFEEFNSYFQKCYKQAEEELKGFHNVKFKNFYFSYTYDYIDGEHENERPILILIFTRDETKEEACYREAYERKLAKEKKEKALKEQRMKEELEEQEYIITIYV